MKRVLLPIGLAAVAVAGCGSAHQATRTGPAAAPRPAPARPARPAPARRYPIALRGARAAGELGWTPAISIGGHVAAWVKRTGAATLVRFNQTFVTLALHAGATDPGGSGWRYGPAVGAQERRRLVAAFNGGFRLKTDTGGFVSYGRVGIPLQFGRASVVTYADGTTDVGAWRQGVPAASRRVASVRQTLQLIVDHGRPAPTIDCGPTCWGFTLRGGEVTARAALGVTAAGRLLWVGGEHLTAAGLADALIAGGAVRAMELDINPDWVHGFLYTHPSLDGFPLVPQQSNGPALYLDGASRDFFTILART